MVHSNESKMRFQYVGWLEVKSDMLPKCLVGLMMVVAA